MLCHGNGNAGVDGCCFVDGAVCPLRWKIVDGRILEGPELLDRGTVEEFAASVSKSKQVQQRVVEQAQGVTFACKAAIEVVVDDPALLSDRDGFEAAWNGHADYVTLVRPHWAAIENRLGLAAGSYQCSSWEGAGGPQCCFAEDQVTNSAKTAGLSSTAVTIRQARGA